MIAISGLFLGIQCQKAKKNDHVFHNACLTHLIKFYDAERERDLKPKILSNIVHTDNCPNQYKCRQNFYHVATSAKAHQSRIVQKFAEKYCFKGSWDATGKLIKWAILKNEKKFDRCANALDCYYKLKRDLSKDGECESNKIWLEWEMNGDERILNNTPLRTRRTFIGLGTEYKDEYDKLIGAGEKHIVFTDRENVPEIPTVEGTQKLFQLHGDIAALPSGKWNLHTATLPCSCPPCRNDPANLSACLYNAHRGIKTKIVSQSGVRAEEETDKHGLAKLTKAALISELEERCLSKRGNKPELRARLEAYLDVEMVEREGLVDEVSAPFAPFGSE